LQPGLQVLSDTMGVDFTDYLRHAYGDVHENWTATIPKEAQASQLKNSVIWIRFTILPDGSIGTMKLEAKSGDMDLDKAAWLAITSEGKFPTLPADFHGPNLELCVAFLYNTPTPATEERPTRAS
jgi:outer membrane biosynthesis protein TonB